MASAPLDRSTRWSHTHPVAYGSERRKLIEKRIAFLLEEEVGLKRSYQRLPYLWGSAVFIVPAFFLWGIVGAVSAVVCVPGLVATGYYIVRIRRQENFGDLNDLERQLAFLKTQDEEE
mgnify:CR=1 FL=1